MRLRRQPHSAPLLSPAGWHLANQPHGPSRYRSTRATSHVAGKGLGRGAAAGGGAWASAPACCGQLEDPDLKRQALQPSWLRAARGRLVRGPRRRRSPEGEGAARRGRPAGKGAAEVRARRGPGASPVVSSPARRLAEPGAHPPVTWRGPREPGAGLAP